MVAGPSNSGNFSPPGTQSFNFFLNNVSITNLDWVEGLKNMSLASDLPSTSHHPLPIAGPALELNPTSSMPVALIQDPSSPHSSSDSGYFLRSSLKKPMGGLGKGLSPIKKGRGRESFLAKAQSKAITDLREGKQ